MAAILTFGTIAIRPTKVRKIQFGQHSIVFPRLGESGSNGRHSGIQHIDACLKEIGEKFPQKRRKLDRFIHRSSMPKRWESVDWTSLDSVTAKTCGLEEDYELAKAAKVKRWQAKRRQRDPLPKHDRDVVVSEVEMAWIDDRAHLTENVLEAHGLTTEKYTTTDRLGKILYSHHFLSKFRRHFSTPRMTGLSGSQRTQMRSKTYSFNDLPKEIALKQGLDSSDHDRHERCGGPTEYEAVEATSNLRRSAASLTLSIIGSQPSNSLEDPEFALHQCPHNIPGQRDHQLTTLKAFVIHNQNANDKSDIFASGEVHAAAEAGGITLPIAWAQQRSIFNRLGNERRLERGKIDAVDSMRDRRRSNLVASCTSLLLVRSEQAGKDFRKSILKGKEAWEGDHGKTHGSVNLKIRCSQTLMKFKSTPNLSLMPRSQKVSISGELSSHHHSTTGNSELPIPTALLGAIKRRLKRLVKNVALCFPISHRGKEAKGAKRCRTANVEPH